MEWSCRRQLGFGALALALVASPVAARAADAGGADVRRELEEMKQQIRSMQETIRKQQRIIERMEAGKPPAAAPVGVAQETPAPGAVAAEAPTPTPSREELENAVAEKVTQRLRPALSAANKTFPSQFNPSIGLVIDNVASYKENERANFEFRSAELGISANIDPFARGYAILNGTEDGVEVEEAAMVTTSLPYNLTVKGGRFFADFGRLAKLHDHNLPFVNRPVVIDRFIGGESQGNGVEVSWLAPLEQYATLTLGAYNRIGAENPRVDNTVPRDLGQFTYLARPATFFNLTDSSSVDLGMSYAYTPHVDSFIDGDVRELRNGRSRHLAGIDLTYRYTPLSEASYHGLIWGTELLYNREDPNFGDDVDPVFRRTDAWGMYSYVEAKLTRRFRPGFLFDYAQDLQRLTGPTKAYSPYLTIWTSEFQRFRLQYTYNDEPGNHESQFFLQWTAVLGSHVHGFTQR